MSEEVDYSELVGKEVNVRLSDGSIKHGVVSYIDYDIGITIQEKDTQKYIFCTNGSLSPLWKEEETEVYEDEKYRGIFDYVAEGIRKGEIQAYRIHEMVMKATGHSTHSRPSAETCAFAQ